jgi:hypothetical protein
VDGVGQHAEFFADGGHTVALVKESLRPGDEFGSELVAFHRLRRPVEGGRAVIAELLIVAGQSFLHMRLTVMSGTPKARATWDWDAVPLVMIWLVKKRNEAAPSTA